MQQMLDGFVDIAGDNMRAVVTINRLELPFAYFARDVGGMDLHHDIVEMRRQQCVGRIVRDVLVLTIPAGAESGRVQLIVSAQGLAGSVQAGRLQIVP